MSIALAAVGACAAVALWLVLNSETLPSTGGTPDERDVLAGESTAPVLAPDDVHQLLYILPARATFLGRTIATVEGTVCQ